MSRISQHQINLLYPTHQRFPPEDEFVAAGSLLALAHPPERSPYSHAGYMCTRLLLNATSANLALEALLLFLERRFPGPQFFDSDAKRLGKIAYQWLARGAGRVFWDESHQHLDLTEEYDEDELWVWPEHKDRLVAETKDLLKQLKDDAKAFYEVSLPPYYPLYSTPFSTSMTTLFPFSPLLPAFPPHHIPFSHFLATSLPVYSSPSPLNT
jgi:hypothetical protein